MIPFVAICHRRRSLLMLVHASTLDRFVIGVGVAVDGPLDGYFPRLRGNVGRRLGHDSAHHLHDANVRLVRKSVVLDLRHRRCDGSSDGLSHAGGMCALVHQAAFLIVENARAVVAHEGADDRRHGRSIVLFACSIATRAPTLVRKGARAVSVRRAERQRTNCRVIFNRYYEQTRQLRVQTPVRVCDNNKHGPYAYQSRTCAACVVLCREPRSLALCVHVSTLLCARRVRVRDYLLNLRTQAQNTLTAKNILSSFATPVNLSAERACRSMWRTRLLPARMSSGSPR